MSASLVGVWRKADACWGQSSCLPAPTTAPWLGGTVPVFMAHPWKRWVGGLSERSSAPLAGHGRPRPHNCLCGHAGTAP